ncbi:MAG: tetratricopeptide repeat protein, partial [Pseudomonadota bacterium]
MRRSRRLFDEGWETALEGDYTASRRLVEDGLRIARRAARTWPDELAVHMQLQFGLMNLADVHQRAEDYRLAVDAYNELDERANALADRFPDVHVIRYDQAVAVLQRGTTHERLEERSKAIADFRRGQAIAEALTEIAPDAKHFETTLSFALEKIGTFYFYEGEPGRALAYLEPALAIVRRYLAESPEDRQLQSQVAHHLDRIAQALSSTGRVADARAAYDEALTILEAHLEEDPDSVPARRAVSNTALRFFHILHLQRDWSVAARWMRRSLAINRSLAAGNASNDRYKAALARSYQRLGIALHGLHVHEESEAMLAQSRQITAALVRHRPKDAERMREHLKTLWALADVLAAQDKLDDME